MSLEARIDLIGERLGILVERLADAGFEFEYPEDTFPGPEEDTDDVIAQIEREVGPLPLALKLFWQRVGSINLCGFHPDWEFHPELPAFAGEAYPDPLVVYPISAAVDELGEFLADKAERLRCDFPYVVPVAPDDKHKADVSGGMFYNISVPAVADDPPLNDEWHHTTFVVYLEESLKWGGFPGLARYPKHTWPVADLTKGF